MTLRSLRARLIGSAALWIAIALTGGGLALSYAFRQASESAFDAKLFAVLNAVIAAADAGAGGRALSVRSVGEARFDQVYSGWYWQAQDGDGLLLRSRSLWDQTLPALPGPARAPRLRTLPRGPRGQPVRVAERDVVLPGHRGPVRFLVALEDRELRRQVRDFDAFLVVVLGVLGGGLVIAIVLQVGYGLNPLRKLAHDLERIRRGDAEHLTGAYASEIAPLVRAMNAVLDHDRQQVARARTHMGDLAHALKTPLSILKAEMRRRLKPAEAEVAGTQIETMARLVDHHLSRAAAGPPPEVFGVHTELAPVVRDVAAGVAHVFAERELEIRTDAPDDLRFAGERQDLEEMLGNLVENASKWAARTVAVSARREGAHMVVTVEDDGPGMSEAQAATAVERGKRLDERTPGSGLGLAIVTDIAELYGGRLTLGRSPLGGLSAVLRLPAAD